MNGKLIVCLFCLVTMVGIVSADTALFYTTNASDGFTSRGVHNATFSSIRNGAGNGYGITDVKSYNVIQSDLTTDTFYVIQRGIIIFNSSILPDDATISSAKIGVYKVNVYTSLGDTGLNIVSFTIDGSISSDDFDNCGVNPFSSYQNISTMGSAKYYNFSLNSSGLSNINKTGNSGFATRFQYDIEDIAPAWISSLVMGFNFATSDSMVNTPFLEVTYTPAVTPPVASFTTTNNFIRIPGTLQVNDTSTNAPSYWNWSWGDGTWTNGTTASEQNATHQYTKRGIWPVYLLAGSIDGDNTSASQTVRVVGYENYW